MDKIKLTPKKILFSIVIVLVMVGVVSLVWVQLRSSSPGESKDVGQDLSTQVDDIQVTAAIYQNEGKNDEGLEYYDEQIAKYSDKEDKRTLLVLKSRFASSAGQFDVALEAAEQADEINSDASTIRALAQAYRENGDKEEALEYYRKLLKIRQAEEGEEDPDKIAESREETLGWIIRELEQ